MMEVGAGRVIVVDVVVDVVVADEIVVETLGGRDGYDGWGLGG